MPIDLRKIRIPTYMLSTREDHIAPWASTYAATQLYRGKSTFVLAGSGHIAGVVNPPSAEKYGYWTNEALPPDPKDWLEGAEQHAGLVVAALARLESRRIRARRSRRGIPATASSRRSRTRPGSYVRMRAA